jgi:hypothetical protein
MKNVRRILEQVLEDPRKLWKAQLKKSDPKLHAYLAAASREAYENTGEAAGEYGTLSDVANLPPSKRVAQIEKKLIYDTVTNNGPDISWERMGSLVAKVRRICPDVIGAWKKGKLIQAIEKAGGFGSQSDRFRHDGDKYY